MLKVADEAPIDAAHHHGLPAIGHLDRIAWSDALSMGLDSIVHIMPISPDLLYVESRQAWRAGARPGTFAFLEWWEMEGFEADLIVLDANPLDDIAHTQANNAVLLDGQWLDSVELSRLSNEGEQP